MKFEIAGKVEATFVTVVEADSEEEAVKKAEHLGFFELGRDITYEESNVDSVSALE